MTNKTCIVIAGPTAVGKTAVAIELAKELKTNIISADSRQCYKELNIGVAKPSAEQLKEVPHYFINTYSVQDNINAKTFEEYSVKKMNDIFKTNDVAVMVGGTGLYIKAFCEGMDDVPEVDTEIKRSVTDNYSTGGIKWLINEIQKVDPLFYAKGEIKNPQRMLRALEVKLSSGRSIIEFQSHKKKERDFKIIKVGLELPKEQLHENIHNRVDGMMQNGLAAEVANLVSFKNLNALQTVGYKELFDYFDGKLSLPEAIEKIKTNTRHYAKRQMTWFKKDEHLRWFSPATLVDELISFSL